MKKRKIYGVIAAEASCIEQRQILSGIMTAGQEKNTDIVVFTNIYNPYESDKDLFCENRIYELMLSPELDGLIVIAESFVNSDVQEIVMGLLAKRQDIPMVVISTKIERLCFSNSVFLNTSDENDMMDIVSHLIEEHDYREIDILTGQIGNEAAEKRVLGYRRALKEHGIPYEPKRVHYGDFWFTSGNELAAKYVKGEIPMPQVVVCANDYMAYGMLDTFAECNVRVPEDIAVTGYENVQERIFHTPLLSTYQRNRYELGKQAVAMLQKPSPMNLTAPKGKWVAGQSCPCQVMPKEVSDEMESIRIHQQYNQWSLYSTMEMKLTQSSSLEEFLQILGSYQYMVRYASNIMVCLYDKWYMEQGASINDRMTFRSVVEWMRHVPTKSCQPYNLSSILYDEAAGYYFTPLFFQQRLMGLIVLRYDHPDCYDIIYRNWLKAVSNGLEFIRMKNDIQYLMHCQSLSESYDTITGLYHRGAMLRELAAVCAHADAGESLFMILIRENQAVTNLHLQSEMEKIRMSQAIASCLRCVQTSHREYLGVLDSQTYLFAGIGQYTEQMQAYLADEIGVLLLHASECFSEATPESYVMLSKSVLLSDGDFEKQLHELEEQAEAKVNDAQNFQSALDDLEFSKLRIQLYHQMNQQPTADECCRKFCFSEGYFRARYKKIYGISFHQDCIQAKISYAKYLLLTGSASVSSIAQQCGYHEDNYFLRQFHHETDMTPNQYRKMKLSVT